MKLNATISRYGSVLVIVVATFVIHGSVLGRFWLADDPQVLLHAVRYGPLEVVSDKAAWQELSTSNFTPLVTWSFDLDLSLFGPDPALFYVHQVVSIALAAIVLWLVMLALGGGPRESLALAILFVAAPPTIHVAGLLMTRHYVEGLVAALLSTLFWILASNRQRHRSVLIVASVLAYLASVLAKEVFMLLPLVHVSLAMGKQRWRTTVKEITPFAIVLAVYLVWRRWMLESTGGYGGGDLVAHLIAVAGQWVRSHPIVAIWFAVVGVICLFSWLRTRDDVVRFALVVVAAFAPLVGIGDQIEGRHLLFPAVVMLTGAVGGINARLRDGSRLALLVALVLVSVIAAVRTGSREAHSIARMEAEGRYVWDQRRDATMLFAGSPGWYLEGLAELDLVWRHESSPEIVYSELGVRLASEESRYLTFSEDGHPRTEYVDDMGSANGYVATAPIEIQIERTGHELRWRFGPRCDCEWRFYSYPAYQTFTVPSEGSRIVPRPRRPQWFRIERRERSGEWTLSPPLLLPREGEMMRWKRDA